MSRHLYLFQDGDVRASAFVATDEMPDASLIRLWACRGDILSGAGGPHFDAWFHSTAATCPADRALVLHGWSDEDHIRFFTRIYGPSQGPKNQKPQTT